MSTTAATSQNRRMAFCVTLLCFALCSYEARASVDAQGYLNAAARFYDIIEYDLAFEYLERARELCRTPEERVYIELYEGIMLANLMEAEQAQEKFRAALRVKRDAHLAVDISPKIRQVFETIRSELSEERGEASTR